MDLHHKCIENVYWNFAKEKVQCTWRTGKVELDYYDWPQIADRVFTAY